MGKEKQHILRLEKSTKNDSIEFRKKTLTKWKSDLKSIKSQNVSSYYGKNWKVIAIMKVGYNILTNNNINNRNNSENDSNTYE